jgi:hypothetical protein
VLKTVSTSCPGGCARGSKKSRRDGLCAIHIFSDSTHAIWNSLDASHHSGQLSSLCICNVILPWLILHDANHVFFHHTNNGVETEDHSLVHLLCTGIYVQAGNSPMMSADYAQQVAIDGMLSEWHIMSHRNYFVCSSGEANNPLVPTHMKGGPWMQYVMTRSDLTAQLLCTITGHVPIGLYYNRLLSHGNLHSACFCSFPTKTVMHQIHDCPDAVHSHPQKHKMCLAWFIRFRDVNMGIFAFNVP